MLRGLRPIALLSAGGALAACAAVIGLEEAEVDPTFQPDNGNAGAAGQDAGAAGQDAGGGTAGSGGRDAGDHGHTVPGDADIPEAGEGALCDDYCETIARNCQGANLQYDSESTCRAICAGLPPGEAGDIEGNTVHCRLQNAIDAQTTREPEVHCPIAGPTGDGFCGTNCDAYCRLMQRYCSDEFGAGLTQCLNACAEVPDIGGYNDSIRNGDTLQCRFWHLGAATASESAARIHCPHAVGAQFCVD